MRAVQRVVANHLAALAILLPFHQSAWPQSFDQDFDPAFDTGRTEFLKDCAVCHGADGKGAGPYSSKLKTKPADLTVLAKRNHGVFSPDAIYKLIEEGAAGRVHLSGDMPTWKCRQATTEVEPSRMHKRRYGRFKPPKTKEHAPTIESLLDLPCDAEPVVKARILAVMGYLSQIQEK